MFLLMVSYHHHNHHTHQFVNLQSLFYWGEIVFKQREHFASYDKNTLKFVNFFCKYFQIFVTIV